MDHLSRKIEEKKETLKKVLSLQAEWSWLNPIKQEDFFTQEALNHINAPADELIGRDGKYWRSAVLEFTHELCQGNLDCLDELCSLVELLHTASLIIDDIEDNAQKRRGGEAIHLLYGIDVSINTANLLYFLPLNLIDTCKLPIQEKYKMMQHSIQAMTRLHYGQGLDILWHNDHAYLPSTEEYLHMCRLKTGALARLCAEIGAISARADDETVQILGQIWEDIGVGFQLLDDVKNLTQDSLGKTLGDDIIEGKKSFPVLCYAKLSPDKGKSLMQIFSQISSSEPSSSKIMVAKAIQMIKTSGALEETMQKAETLLDAALASLKKHFSASLTLFDVQTLIASFWEKIKS